MKDSNEMIERVLHGLRDTEPADGMESRILSAMHARAAEAPRPDRAKLLSPRLWALATCTAVVCAICWSAFRPHPPVSPHTAANASTHTDAASAPASQTASAVANSAPRLQPYPAVRAAGGIKTLASASSTGTTSNELPDTLAPSRPAPPMPLTNQEHLLLRIAHKGDPVELASLNIDLNRRADEEAEAFKLFFRVKPDHTADEPAAPADQAQIDVQQSSDTQQTPVEPVQEAQPQ